MIHDLIWAYMSHFVDVATVAVCLMKAYSPANHTGSPQGFLLLLGIPILTCTKYYHLCLL